MMNRMRNEDRHIWKKVISLDIFLNFVEPEVPLLALFPVAIGGNQVLFFFNFEDRMRISDDKPGGFQI